MLKFYPWHLLAGLCCEGIYQKNGDPGRVAQLQEVFTKDARIVKLRLQDHQLEDVTDTLKSFLSHSEDALLAKELYPFWISTLGLWFQPIDSAIDITLNSNLNEWCLVCILICVKQLFYIFELRWRGWDGQSTKI